MEQIIVQGGTRLKGTVKIEGAKNASLPILAASLLVEEGITTLKNVPTVTDVLVMVELIKHLNVYIDFNEESNQITIDATRTSTWNEANFDYVSKIRASVLVIGPSLARNGYVKIAMPGGCAIGKRPIDLHLKGFQALGAKVVQRTDHIEIVADNLIGQTIYLELPSVGATQNIMMAAVKAKGTTVIENAAKEPEVMDLALFLNKMGAKIIGAGTEKMRIEGVEKLNGVSYSIMQDRIEAGTFMVAAAMTEGEVLIEGAIPKYNLPLIAKLMEMGAAVREESDGLRVIGPKVIKPTNIMTLPHPGFSTDMQAQITAMLLFADGTSIIEETLFENRFLHLNEMQRMNADVEIHGHIAVVNGGQSILGADVQATDLRAAAALILAGLRANGITRVSHLEHLDRGYYKFHEKLEKLGAKVKRVKYIPSFTKEKDSYGATSIPIPNAVIQNIHKNGQIKQEI